MTQPTNLYSSYDAASTVPGGSIREDLGNRVWNVAPSETPLGSELKRTTAKNRKHEWLLDTLDAASSTNYHAEGSDFAASAITAPTRKNNVCQISKKDFTISETQEVVDKAGRDSEVAYQYALKAKALKTDIESQILANNAAVDTNEATARELGGLPAWIETNVSRGSGGSNGTSGTTAATDGTQRALTESLLLSVAQSLYTNSSTSERMMLLTGAFNKRVIATFSGSGTRTFDAMSKKVMNNVAIYETPFNQVLTVELDRYIRTREVMLLQPDYLALAFLRPISRQKFAKDGDNQKHGLVCEYTLEVRNEKALGIVADLNDA